MNPPILLSVLIPSIPKRANKLANIMARLEAQSDPQLEVIVLIDNCRRALGSKRNEMMRMAQGKFLAHIDDDEDLAADYFATLKPELQHDYDLIHYDAAASLNGSPDFKVTTILGAENEQPKLLPGGRYSDIVRQPWHWSVWRTDFARRFPFPSVHDGAEDWYFLKQALPEVKTSKKIDRILFFHRYSATETTFKND